MTDTERDTARLTASLEQILAMFGTEPGPDEITERFGDQPPEMLRRLRLAGALAGIADRLIYDASAEAQQAGIDTSGQLEAAERQTSIAFDPGGHFADSPLPLLFRLMRMQRAFWLRSMSAPTADPATDSASAVTDPMLFTAGMAVVVSSSVLRFDLACANGDERAEAAEAEATWTALDELRRLAGGTVAAREVRGTNGPRSQSEGGSDHGERQHLHTGEPASAESPLGHDDSEEFAPMTVGRLRQYLAHSPLPDDLPVIVGGLDVADRTKKIRGLADALWADDEGEFGGRLCLGAMGIGLLTEQDGHLL